MAIAGVAIEPLRLTPWHMPAPMCAHARAFSSSSAPAGPLPLWLSMPTHVPHRVRRARRCHHARHSHRTTVPRAMHTLAALAPSAAAYPFARPAVAPLPRAASSRGHLLSAAPSATPAAYLPSTVGRSPRLLRVASCCYLLLYRWYAAAPCPRHCHGQMWRRDC